MPALPPPAIPSPARTALLTVIALIAFAGNSLLCRVALKQTGIDAASFTSVRLASGALVLALLVLWRARGLSAGDAPTRPWHTGNWISALALFVYAAGFSFAYLSLSAATGALLLFGVVQTTMIGWGLWRGERLRPLQWLGLIAASAGVAWAVYTLRGRASGPSSGDATAVTAGNFLRATPLALGVSALLWTQARWDTPGLLLALASGALASGLGYAVWYTALRGLTATRAAILQLTVPALATAGGVLLLGEPLSAQLLGASVAVLGGVALVIAARAPARR